MNFQLYVVNASMTPKVARYVYTQERLGNIQKGKYVFSL